MTTSISHLPSLTLTERAFPLPTSAKRTPTSKATPEKSEEKECFNVFFTLFNAAFLMVLFFLLPFLAMTQSTAPTQVNQEERQFILGDNLFLLKTLNFTASEADRKSIRPVLK